MPAVMDYHRLGRVYPRAQLRMPWERSGKRRFAAELFPVAAVTITGLGRLEYTFAREQLEYTMEDERLEFTLEDERMEFTGVEP